jgi:hypothetical protein
VLSERGGLAGQLEKLDPVALPDLRCDQLGRGVGVAARALYPDLAGAQRALERKEGAELPVVLEAVLVACLAAASRSARQRAAMKPVGASSGTWRRPCAFILWSNWTALRISLGATLAANVSAPRICGANDLTYRPTHPRTAENPAYRPWPHAGSPWTHSWRVDPVHPACVLLGGQRPETDHLARAVDDAELRECAPALQVVLVSTGAVRGTAKIRRKSPSASPSCSPQTAGLAFPVPRCGG